MRSKSFIYVVEVEGTERLVKAVSKGRAVKALFSEIKVRRATPVEVADFLSAGAEMVDATKEPAKESVKEEANNGKSKSR